MTKCRRPAIPPDVTARRGGRAGSFHRARTTGHLHRRAWRFLVGLRCGVKNLNAAAPPLELVLKGGDPERVALWGCGTCHVSARTREDAVACCAPWVCETCGREVKSYCEDCSRKERQAKERAVYDRAKKVTWAEYGSGWLCCDHCDEYFADVDSLLDAHDDDAEQRTWAWGTYEVTFKLDADDIISSALENQEFYDGAQERIPSAEIKALQAALDAWAARQDLKAYMVDHDVVVEFGEVKS